MSSADGRIGRPTPGEIEAYYLSDTGLSPERHAAVKEFVEDNYLDGGTRAKFIARRKEVEAAIVQELDSD